MDKCGSFDYLDCIEHEAGSVVPSHGPRTTAEVFKNLRRRWSSGDIFLDKEGDTFLGKDSSKKSVRSKT